MYRIVTLLVLVALLSLFFGSPAAKEKYFSVKVAGDLGTATAAFASRK